MQGFGQTQPLQSPIGQPPVTNNRNKNLAVLLYALGSGLRGQDPLQAGLGLRQTLQQQALQKQKEKEAEEIKAFESKKRQREESLFDFKSKLDLPEGLSTGGKILFTANKLSEAGFVDASLPYYEFAKKYESTLTDKDKFEFEKNLRSEYDKKSKDIVLALDQARISKKALEQMTGIGDIQAVFSFMKAVDPGSRVTEGEIQLTAAAGGKLRTLAAFANKAATGKVFDPATRKEMWQLMSEITRDSIRNFSNLQNQYQTLSTQYGVDAQNVIAPYAFDMEYISTPLFSNLSPESPDSTSNKNIPY